MIALQHCATPEQKARWLRPLLEAETPFGVRDDRTRCGFFGCDQYRDQNYPRSPTTTLSTGANGSITAPRIRDAVFLS
jgi:hypothetical protein